MAGECNVGITPILACLISATAARPAGGSLTIDLPDGVTIDGWHAVSIWCVDVPVSFGQGTFQAPPCRADMDGDGEMTIFDFLAFQNESDAGC